MIGVHNYLVFRDKVAHVHVFLLSSKFKGSSLTFAQFASCQRKVIGFSCLLVRINIICVKVPNKISENKVLFKTEGLGEID